MRSQQNIPIGSRSLTPRRAIALAVALMLPALATGNPVRPLIPGLPDTGLPSTTAPDAPTMSAEGIARLKATYEASSAEERSSLKAYYADLGVDIGTLLDLGNQEKRDMQRAQRLRAALAQVQAGMARSPAAVLAARTKLSRSQAYPDAANANVQLVVVWVRDHVLAGNWEAIGDFLAPLPRVQSQAMYGCVLNALRAGESGLLPEEVLKVADAAPAELTEQQVHLLAMILRNAASKHGTSELMRAIHAGTKAFGTDDARRSRTLDLLKDAGLDREAYEFLPPLQEARTAGDARVILEHGRYLQYLANHLRQGDETNQHRARAWALLCEAAVHPKVSPDDRTDAMERAIRLMEQLPRPMIEPWLREVFASETLGPLVIEKITLNAVALGNANIQRAERIRRLVTLKEAVDILLGSDPAERESLRIPLRMLTTAIAQELENASNKRVSRVDRALLLRAVPSPAWLDALNPSLAVRISGASIELAAGVGDISRAVVLLEDAVDRTPDPAQAQVLAERFLKRWAAWLGRVGEPKIWTQSPGSNMAYQRSMLPPVTRGLQRRNLDELREVLEILEPLGVDSRHLPSIGDVFTVCHNPSEAFQLADIERVFGPIDQLPADTARHLAEAVSAAVDGYWRGRSQASSTNTPGQPAPPQRPNAVIVRVVDRGMETANQLADRAQRAAPDDWETDQLKATLALRWLSFRTKTDVVDEAERLAQLRDAYAVFERAAASYAKALASGSQQETSDLFVAWFKTAMGAADVSRLTADVLPLAGTLQDNQFDHIAAALHRLPPDASYRHIAEFAEAVNEAITNVPPEGKPRFVNAAIRIVGDHPAGAPIRARHQLYRELMNDEVKLRLTIDGPSEIRAGVPFGVAVSVRFTSAVDRETEGFSKYLRNNVAIAPGREINYRDLLERTIETAFSKSFDHCVIGFYHPEFPPWGVLEDGQDEWLEKPLAYVIVTPKDASVDRLPQITMEMQFYEGRGYVNVVTSSNTPQIAVGEGPAERPCDELLITQVVDGRDALAQTTDRSVRLEVTARGRGSVPGLAHLLDGIEGALPGYSAGPNGIEPAPTLILNGFDVAPSRSSDMADSSGYPEPDANGIVRPVVERSWTVTYQPDGSASSGRFRLPRLGAETPATLVSKHYATLDIAPISGEWIDLGFQRHRRLPYVAAGSAIVATFVLFLLIWARRRKRPITNLASPLTPPARLTPLSVVTALRRWYEQLDGQLTARELDALEADIHALEYAYFGPGSDTDQEELNSVVKRWAGAGAAQTCHAKPQ